MSKHYEHVVRVCVESTTPLSIQGGDTVNLEDANILTDANGFPMLVGKSIRGLLRSLYGEEHGIDKRNQLFGNQVANKGNASDLCIDFGCVHDKNNKPVTGLVDQDTINSDEVLSYLQSLQFIPLLRERNAINAKGVTTGKALYSYAIAPKGLRYTFEISLDADEKNRPVALDSVLHLLGSLSFRLGRNHYKNLGAFKVISIKHYLIDKKLQKSIDDFPVCLSDDSGFTDITEEITRDQKNERWSQTEYRLKAIDFWRVGAGSESFLPLQEHADLLPYSEPALVWDDQNKPEWKTFIVLPGTSIIGVLSHRLAFHYRCEQQLFADDLELDKHGVVQFPAHTDCEAVKALFGEKVDHDEQQGRAGLILIDDLFLAPDGCDFEQQIHNKLSHHLGGTIDGALFSEELLWQTEIELKFIQREALGNAYQAAWEKTLADLFEGRLAIGAASGRGHGCFKTINNKEATSAK